MLQRDCAVANVESATEKQLNQASKTGAAKELHRQPRDIMRTWLSVTEVRTVSVQSAVRLNRNTPKVAFIWCISGNVLFVTGVNTRVRLGYEPPGGVLLDAHRRRVLPWMGPWKCR